MRDPKKNHSNALETRKKILDAVIRLSHQYGIENITLQKAAKKAGVSYFAVHYHFNREKVNLAKAAIDHVAEVAETLIEKKLRQASQDPTANLLEAYIEAQFSWVQDLPEYASLWLHHYYLCGAEQVSQKTRLEAIQSAQLRIRKTLLESIGKGQLPPLDSIESLAEKIHFEVLGALLMAIFLSKNQKKSAHQKLALEASLALIQSHRQKLKKRSSSNPLV